MSAAVTSWATIQEAILGTLRAAFLDRVETYAPYSLAETRPINTPALLLDLDGFDDGDDLGDGRTEILADWTIYGILSTATPDYELQVREMIREVKALVTHNLWGLPGAVGFPDEVIARPAQFRGGEDGYASWCVMWRQKAILGPPTWPAEGIIPKEVWLGFPPNTGAAHVDDYVQVASEADLPQF